MGFVLESGGTVPDSPSGKGVAFALGVVVLRESLDPTDAAGVVLAVAVLAR